MASGAFKDSFYKAREKQWAKKRGRVKPHRSFRRSYREDYAHPIKLPGLLEHTAATFRILKAHWKTLILLLIFLVLMYIVFVGLMSEETYTQFQDLLDQTSTLIAGGPMGSFAQAALLISSTIATGGLSQNTSESQSVFGIFIFLIAWLTTIYLVRHYLAKKNLKLRDALYHSLSPLLSTIAVFLVIMLELVPIFLVIITFSAAISTASLSTPFYALVCFIFAALMFILSLYLVSSSFIGLVAVSAPGLYPLTALFTASDLVQGRRLKLIIRILYLLVVLVLLWAIIMIPGIMLDLWLKSSWSWLVGFPFIPLMLLTMTCFTFIFVATYFYLLYRRLLSADIR
jgi:hypothetical protein